MFPVPPSVTVTLDEVVSRVAAVTATVTPVSPPVVVVAADVAPVVETPDVTVAETPDIIGMITAVPVVVVACVTKAGVVTVSPPIVVVVVVVAAPAAPAAAAASAVAGVAGAAPVVPPVPPVGSAAGGAEKMVFVEASVGALLSRPDVPGLVWARLGNCQAKDMKGVKLRAKMRFLIFNMMIL